MQSFWHLRPAQLAVAVFGLPESRLGIMGEASVAK